MIFWIRVNLTRKFPFLKELVKGVFCDVKDWCVCVSTRLAGMDIGASAVINVIHVGE